ncbi:hypothetical protein AA313_de0209856 [Arthrobotrys entomopaga]|nr:hypothetical protein AA313_de0209856 [Arthrobotrys entomopaga]
MGRMPVCLLIRTPGLGATSRISQKSCRLSRSGSRSGFPPTAGGLYTRCRRIKTQPAIIDETITTPPTAALIAIKVVFASDDCVFELSFAALRYRGPCRVRSNNIEPTG